MFTINNPVTLLVFFVALAATVAGVVLDVNSTLMVYGNVLARYDDPIYWISLATYSFAHGGFNHFIGNMLLFLLLAPQLEQRLGKGQFVKSIFITSVVIAIAHGFIDPNVGLVGASGLVFMAITMISITASKCDKIPVTFLLVVALYFGQEVFNALQPDNVSQLAHIAGGIMGIVLGWKWKKSRGAIDNKIQ